MDRLTEFPSKAQILEKGDIRKFTIGEKVYLNDVNFQSGTYMYSIQQQGTNKIMIHIICSRQGNCYFHRWVKAETVGKVKHSFSPTAFEKVLQDKYNDAYFVKNILRKGY